MASVAPSSYEVAGIAAPRRRCIPLRGYVRSLTSARLSARESASLRSEVDRLSTDEEPERVGDQVAAVPPVAVALVRRIPLRDLWLWWRRRASSDVVLIAVTRTPPPA